MSSSKPEITVAMPAYNAAAHLLEAIDSILAQSFEDFELLVVDDAVSSGTTMVSGIKLLARCGAEVAAIAVAMRQGMQWQSKLRRADGAAIPVVGAYDCPRMERRADGWWPEGL